MVTKRDEISIDASDLLSRITIKVTMPRMMGVRFAIAAWLLRLAGRVSGTNVIIDIPDDTDDHPDAACDWYVRQKAQR